MREKICSFLRSFCKMQIYNDIEHHFYDMAEDDITAFYALYDEFHFLLFQRGYYLKNGKLMRLRKK